MVAGVHFLPDDPPDLIGRKLLRVNLSDLAAKGATPLGYLMTVSAPRDTPDAWFAGFAAGLAADQAEFAVTLLGGDTTSTPGPISLSLTIIGHVAPGRMVRRAGARAGDGIWVTGTIGDGALGLAVAQRKLADATGYLLDRYRLPRPRLGTAHRRHRVGRDGCLRRAGAGPWPSLPRRGPGRRDRGRPRAAVRPRPRRRPRLACHLPDRRRRLRAAAGGARRHTRPRFNRQPKPSACLSRVSEASVPARPASWSATRPGNACSRPPGLEPLLTTERRDNE